MREILLPPRAEIDVPPPEPPDERLGVPVIMRPQLAGLAGVGFCFGHGCWVWWVKIRNNEYRLSNGPFGNAIHFFRQGVNIPLRD